MKRQTFFYLVLITLFAAITRFWYFWADPLHVDEYWTLEIARTNVSHIVHFTMVQDCNPPLFYLADHLSYLAFGYTAFAERLPSVLFGILLIPAVFLLGKQIKNDTLGLLATLGVATLGSMWYYSGFGRSYMLNCLLFTLFTLYFIRICQNDGRKGENWLVLTAIATLLAYSHLFTLIPMSFLYLYLFFKDWKQTTIWSTIVSILTAPLGLLFNAILKERAVDRVTAKAVGWNWYGATVPQLVIFAPLEFFGYSFVFWIPLIIYSCWKNRERWELLAVIASWILSFGTLLALSDITPVFIRYTLLCVPAGITVGLLPVADLIDSKEHTRAQKAFIIGSFGIIYFAIIMFEFWSGLYAPKGTITI